MIIEKTPLQDLLILTPAVFKDDRGYFFESYKKNELDQFFKTDFVQDNESLSQKDVLRGLHFQRPPHSQAKLVRVIKGSVLDVAVDLRTDSPTYGKHFKHILSEENKQQLFVPKGFAHGFLVLEKDTIFSYKCSEYYNKSSEEALLWCDETLAIDWGIHNPIISEKDSKAKKFSSFTSPF